MAELQQAFPFAEASARSMVQCQEGHPRLQALSSLIAWESSCSGTCSHQWLYAQSIQAVKQVEQRGPLWLKIGLEFGRLMTFKQG